MSDDCVKLTLLSDLQSYAIGLLRSACSTVEEVIAKIHHLGMTCPL